MMGNFSDAVRQLEIALVCPKCSAMNRPGATIIEVGQGRVAVCACCSYSWTVGK